jgi:hypothetical protein
MVPREGRMIGFLVVLAACAVGWAGGRGIALLMRGIRHADERSSSLWAIRGIRGIAVAVGTAALAGGILLEQTWLLAFGAVFLVEELYETGIVALVLRADQKHFADDRGWGSPRGSESSTPSDSAQGRTNQNKEADGPPGTPHPVEVSPMR